MTTVKPRPSTPLPAEGPSEYDILKQNHRFLLEDEHEPDKGGHDSWNETLARKFYSNLWKEYAICDLKHYKSGNFSLRWRTEDEVVSGAGETSCGNTRCKHHEPRETVVSTTARYGRGHSKTEHKSKGIPVLRTLELPFGYVEQGEVKSALVKVVLCEKCVRKIMWRREQLKKNASEQLGRSPSTERGPDATRANKSDYEGSNQNSDHAVSRDVGRSSPEQESRRRRRSRSRSPDRRPTRDRPKD